MKSIIKFFKYNYRRVLQSIAFYPVLISLLYVLAAVVSLKVDSSELVEQLKEKVPYLFIQDYETVRAMLSTFVGGIISLTVFSFSMVMVVLGQASSDFSPRLLPGLISNKKNQVILGIYVGTLLYCTLILLSLGAYGTDSYNVGMSAMLAAVMSVICIVLFIYFINSISKAIQIHNIIDGIYERCNSFLARELGGHDATKVGLQYIDSQEWKQILSDRSGYFRGFDRALMSSATKEVGNQIEIVPYLNRHIWKGDVAIRVKNNISDEAAENLLFCMDISSDRHEDDKGIGGMIKLMEIAVKAMSPGINDPGTAIDAVTKLGSLLSKFLQFPHMVSNTFDGGELILIENHIPAEELMRILVQPIRLYSKKDSSVMYELINALQFMYDAHGLSRDDRQALADELEATRRDIEMHIDNEYDKQGLLALLEDQGEN
ncbi:DUF2254 domain-containing protein [Pricia sp. S334]|uniref:DUF2254 domain-containing protein n=1 Tax=Pricia mediterranea TaxID=3076079 RepID=A0ABU3L3W7_9FLAO|nr:DUF2254 domain-containing protein [Pricia sp. S334]MDT7827787.1 DUF2254 domain-containing protein [Pricia sp. S334]